MSGALLYGIRSPESSAELGELVQAAPELALVLLDRGISPSGARSSDMKRLESRTGRIISPEFVSLVAAGVPLDEGDVNRLTHEVPDGFEVLIEAATEVSDEEGAILTLSSKLVHLGSNEVVEPMSSYRVYLKEMKGQAVGVEGYPLLTAKVYEIIKLEGLSACHECGEQGSLRL